MKYLNFQDIYFVIKSKMVEKRQNIVIRFFKKLLDPSQYTSIKSLAMLASIIISLCLSTCLGYAMVLDVWIDGILNMDLIDAGVFITCLGSFMSLASIPKVIIDKIKAKREFPIIEKEEEVEVEEKCE